MAFSAALKISLDHPICNCALSNLNTSLNSVVIKTISEPVYKWELEIICASCKTKLKPAPITLPVSFEIKNPVIE